MRPGGPGRGGSASRGGDGRAAGAAEGGLAVRAAEESSGCAVFAYGTLMFPAVWQKVTGEDLPSRPAQLPNCAARRLRGQTYPVLVPQGGACTAGVLYEGVSAAALARLDVFEGDFYVRRSRQVSCADGARRPAWVYLAALPESPEILLESWDAESFARDSLEEFLRADSGFAGAAEAENCAATRTKTRYDGP